MILTRGRILENGTLVSDEDLKSGRNVCLIPDDPTMSDYDRHLVENGHKPGVLNGRDIPKSERYIHIGQRRALIRRMGRLHNLKPRLCRHVSTSPVWAIGWVALVTPVRVVVADRELAAEAADELYFQMLDFCWEHQDKDWGKEALQRVETICLHFDGQMKLARH